MPKFIKILTMLLTIAPFILTILWFNQPMESEFSYVYPLNALLLLLLVVYTTILLKTKMEKGKKLLWFALFFFANFLVFPVFWFLYVWKHDE